MSVPLPNPGPLDLDQFEGVDLSTLDESAAPALLEECRRQRAEIERLQHLQAAAVSFMDRQALRRWHFYLGGERVDAQTCAHRDALAGGEEA